MEGASGYSPYSGLSAFAGNPLLISPELLVKSRLLERSDLDARSKFSDEQVDFDKAIEFLLPLLNKAFRTFQDKGAAKQAGSSMISSARRMLPGSTTLPTTWPFGNTSRTKRG